MIIIGLSVFLFFIVSIMVGKYLKFRNAMYKELTEQLNFILTILEINKQKNMAQLLNNATKRDRSFLWN